MTEIAPDRCPAPEDLEAYAASPSTAPRWQHVTAHLLDCTDCRGYVVRMSIGRLQQTSRRRHSRRKRSVEFAAATAITTVICFTAVQELQSTRRFDPYLALVSSPAHSRLYAGRLSGGFAWAPLGEVPRTGPRTDAAAALLASEPNGSPASRQNVAAAAVVAGEPGKAVGLLLTIPEHSRDAGAWNDLSAAYLSQASADDLPALYSQALAAADASIALEDLGLRDAAVAAWRAYLSVGSDPPGHG